MGWHKGGRIWVFWKPNLFDIQFLSYSAQHIHMLVHSQIDNKRFYLTFIYAFNDLNGILELWKFLKKFSEDCHEPWLWLGDFNTVLSPVERLGGSTSDAEMEHFQDCVSICCMEDIVATGTLFTWSNKQAPLERVYSRLDRAMGNLEWFEQFGDSVAHFHPEGLFDHCPCTVRDRNSEIKGRKSFKYFNMWGTAPNFKSLVSDCWSKHYQGTKMFGIIKKLKALKSILKALNMECFSDIENNTNIASLALETLQKALIDNPSDADLLQQELDLAHDLKDLIISRDSFLIQKAKSAFLDYYKELLGSHKSTDTVNSNVVRQGMCCTKAHWTLLNRPVTTDEIKKCLFSIPSNKSPGPDGYSSHFYKDAWDIVGNDICEAVINFFDTGKLLTQINSTVITLIPKIDRPTSVKHYRPISCCNVLYKIISKLLCSRLALILPDLICKTQGAFVKGRSILENILICQDLIRQYNRGKASPRCLFKLELQKAYDSIEWAFVDQMLEALLFPEKFRRMIMLCISTPTYTLNLNGAHFGFFNGRRGLRQGDLISPLIFCICMEYLSRLMDFATRKWYFRYHPMCKSLILTHLLFADDLLMFSKGDVQSIMLILRVLATFSGSSGLKVNAAKSEVVFNGVPESLKHDIAQVSGFQEGKLPFKYFGIPIQPGRLTKADCNVLLDKIVSKIRGIGARKLIYAGRLVLINSVLNTLHNYWASIFLIPKGVVKRIEGICRNFLWCGGSEYNRAPLVAWHHVCCSKKEGGLSIKDVGVWNIASVGKLVNWIYTKADRLWDPHPPVLWYHDVWDPRVLPKQAFIGLETWLQLKLNVHSSSSSKLQRIICRVVKLAAWYAIWMQRNFARLDLTLCRPEKLTQQIQQQDHGINVLERHGDCDGILDYGVLTFNKKTKWPSWNDEVFITEMYNAQHRVRVYTEMAKSSNYSWKLPALWDLIATTVEQFCIRISRCQHTPAVLDENTLKTSAGQLVDVEIAKEIFVDVPICHTMVF
ncbi:uncharacterized protein LOC141629455 [Silene latifolia]|uniref:uncharacterized protein LOC141629455 n=1 Tax=Silene latifolia TaxID=37657 RepID=UPI003D78AD5F